MSTPGSAEALKRGWEHYDEAVKCLEAATSLDANNEQRAVLLAAAQVHATLFVGCMSALGRRGIAVR